MGMTNPELVLYPLKVQLFHETEAQLYSNLVRQSWLSTVLNSCLKLSPKDRPHSNTVTIVTILLISGLCCIKLGETNICCIEFSHRESLEWFHCTNTEPAYCGSPIHMSMEIWSPFKLLLLLCVHCAIIGIQPSKSPPKDFSTDISQIHRCI